MKKQFTFNVPASSFYRNEEEKKKLEEEFFKREVTSEDLVEVKTNLEAILWSMFTRLPAPVAPLKAKAFESWLLELSKTLTASQSDSEALPQLSKEDLSKIRHFLEDDKEFDALEVSYDIRSLPDGEERGVNLPAVNLVRDREFMNTLTGLFE